MKKNYLLYLVLLIPCWLFSQVISETHKSVASDRAADDNFGRSVAISKNYAIVGANGEDHDVSGGSFATFSGSAYVYERDISTGNWSEVQKIVASDRAADDNFGYSVSISGDYAIIGAYREDHDASGGGFINATGSAYIFERNGAGVWTEVQKIVASDRASQDNFGRSVSISGNYAVVGAHQEDSDASGGSVLTSSGSAYVFERNGAGVWTEVQKIVASDRSTSDEFGRYVAISGDNIVVGAYLEDHDVSGGNVRTSSGSAYIFERDGSGTWTEVQKIVASDRSSSDNFGYGIAISGGRLVVGSYNEDHDVSGGNARTNSGSAYIYEKNSSGVWSEVQKVVASDRASEDIFGIDVSISGDFISISAFREDEDASGANTASNSGSVYIFERDESGTWIELQKIVASDRDADDEFGVSAAVSGDLFIVGAYREDQNVVGGATASNAGSVYFYHPSYDITYNSGSWSGGSGGSGEPTSADGNKTLKINGTTSLSTNVSLERITIEDGSSLTLNPSASLSLSRGAIVFSSEGIVLESDATGTASLIDAGVVYENSGSIKVERYIPFTSTAFAIEGYHYIGSPIRNHAKFADMTDLYGYSENDLQWIHHTDATNGFSNYSPGEGYAIRYTSNITKEFIGDINTGDVTIAVTSTNHGGDIFEHFNLLANPYPSSISANSLVSANSSVLGATLYFWNGEDYATYNTSLSSGTAGSIGVAPDGNIAVGQAFFIEAISAGDVTFTDAMRGTDSDIFYKKASFPKLRLLVTSGEEKSDLLVTGHQSSSKDVDEYDAKQLQGTSGLSLGTLLNGRAYDIESVPELSGHCFDLIVRSSSAKEITFRLEDFHGLEGNRVYLEDRDEGTLTDITEGTYTTYMAAVGEERNRFKLRVASEDPSEYNVWINDGEVNVFKNGDQVTGKITLIGLDGRVVSSSESNYISNWAHLPLGVYMLEFENGQDHHVSKVTKH